MTHVTHFAVNVYVYEKYKMPIDSHSILRQVRHVSSSPWRRWLAQADISDDPEGDLIADLQYEARQTRKTRPLGLMPDTFRSLGEFIEYLELNNACSGAIDAAPAVWAQYRSYLATSSP
jgi:hypothetical protein